MQFPSVHPLQPSNCLIFSIVCKPKQHTQDKMIKPQELQQGKMTARQAFLLTLLGDQISSIRVVRDSAKTHASPRTAAKRTVSLPCRWRAEFPQDTDRFAEKPNRRSKKSSSACRLPRRVPSLDHEDERSTSDLLPYRRVSTL